MSPACAGSAGIQGLMRSCCCPFGADDELMWLVHCTAGTRVAELALILTTNWFGIHDKQWPECVMLMVEVHNPQDRTFTWQVLWSRCVNALINACKISLLHYGVWKMHAEETWTRQLYRGGVLACVLAAHAETGLLIAAVIWAEGLLTKKFCGRLIWISKCARGKTTVVPFCTFKLFPAGLQFIFLFQPFCDIADGRVCSMVFLTAGKRKLKLPFEPNSGALCCCPAFALQIEGVVSLLCCLLVCSTFPINLLGHHYHSKVT